MKIFDLITLFFDLIDNFLSKAAHAKCWAHKV